MLPPFLGALVLLATLGGLALAMIALIWARLRRRPALTRFGLVLGVASIAGYAALWLLGIALARPRLLPMGGEVSFCGLDCHLHVGVEGMVAGETSGVAVRFRSNAVRAPEYPGLLLFRLRDDSGRTWESLNRPVDDPLPAGAERHDTLHFAARLPLPGARLEVSWRRRMDYLVPGAGNPLVQRRTGLAILARER